MEKNFGIHLTNLYPFKLTNVYFMFAYIYICLSDKLQNTFKIVYKRQSKSIKKELIMVYKIRFGTLHPSDF